MRLKDSHPAELVENRLREGVEPMDAIDSGAHSASSSQAGWCIPRLPAPLPQKHVSYRSWGMAFMSRVVDRCGVCTKNIG